MLLVGLVSEGVAGGMCRYVACPEEWWWWWWFGRRRKQEQ